MPSSRSRFCRMLATSTFSDRAIRSSLTPFLIARRIMKCSWMADSRFTLWL